MKEFINFVCTDSSEIFLSKLRTAGLNYNLQVFSMTLTVRGVSNKHCLLTFFIFIRITLITIYGYISPNKKHKSHSCSSDLMKFAK